MQNKIIPTLRFPEFSGSWKPQKIGHITTKVNSGKTPKGGESCYVTEGVMFIRSQNVCENILSFENVTYISKEVNDTMKNSVVKPNDILLNITGASLGRSCVVPENFITGNVNQHVCIIRLDKSYTPHFLQPILASEFGQKIFNSLQVGSGREGLNFESIRSITIHFPTLPEQQKIAAFLTAVDERIQALKKKKTLLEQYKKGVMQQLFSQQLRFKDDDGGEFPDWENLPLGDLLSYEQPTKYLVNSTEYDDSYATPVLTAGKTFILGYTNETEGIFKKNLPVIIFDDFTTGMQFVDFPFKAKSSAMKILLPKKGVNIFFVYEAMQCIKYVVGGHERHWISKYSLIEVPVPCKDEQTKIANFLSAINKKIKQTEAQIEKTELYKKGLLQQMFC